MKFNKLLNKVNAFEKVALYSDRKAFLQALATHVISADILTPDIRSKMESLLKNLNALEPNSTSLQNQLMDALHSETVNLDGVINTIHEAVNAIPAGHGPQLDQAMDLIVGLQKLIQHQDADQTAKPIVPSENSEVPPAATKSSLTSIEKPIQAKLNQLLGPDGEIMPLKEDGILGDKTYNAIKIFQKKYNVPGNYSLADILQVIKSAN